MGSQSESITRTVVSNVLVLAAGTRYDQEDPKRDGKPIPTTVVTVAVTPPDAERITMAQAEGKVMLALRNPPGHAADGDDRRQVGRPHGAACPAASREGP